MEDPPGRDPALKTHPGLPREPLFWAAAAAFVGAIVGLVGTLSLAVWLGDISAGMPQPPLASLATPFGNLLTMVSLAGVLALTEASNRKASRIARVGGVALLLVSLLATLMIIGFELGLILLEGDWMRGGPPLLFTLLSVSFFAHLVLPCVVVVPFALVALSNREARVGIILVGLCVFCAPFLLAWQALSDGMVGRIPEHATAVVLLGGIGAGVSLPAAPLWVLLAAIYFRRAHRSVLGEAFRAQEKVNLKAARRLYEEGLALNDASVVDELVSEDLRDLRRGARGKLAMERVFSALWKSYPDLSVTVEDQKAEGDLVRTRLMLSGTDRGGVLWYPPTGRRAAFTAEFADRFSGGELIEHSGETDTEDLLRQLGLTQARATSPSETQA